MIYDPFALSSTIKIFIYYTSYQVDRKFMIVIISIELAPWVSGGKVTIEWNLNHRTIIVGFDDNRWKWVYILPNYGHPTYDTSLSHKLSVSILIIGLLMKDCKCENLLLNGARQFLRPTTRSQRDVSDARIWGWLVSRWGRRMKMLFFEINTKKTQWKITELKIHKGIMKTFAAH